MTTVVMVHIEQKHNLGFESPHRLFLDFFRA